MVNDMKRVLVIGMDGATWDLIKPWAERGKLPTFRRLLEEGAHGDLISILPISSAVEWSVMLTGKQPGKLGIFDFIRRKSDSYDLEVVCMREEWNPLWKILNDTGHRFGIMGVPLTLVPEREINGIFVVGAITYAKGRLANPPELDDFLRKINYEIHVPPAQAIGMGPYLERVKQVIRKKFDVALQLFKRDRWSFFMFCIYSTDMVSHTLWKYMDKEHPLYTPNERLESAILECYQLIDKCLSLFLKHLPEDTVLMLVSDHGQGPLYKYVDLNTWLKQSGFLECKERLETHSYRRRIVDTAKSRFKHLLFRYLSRYQLRIFGITRRLIPSHFFKKIIDMLMHIFGLSTHEKIFGDIKWEGTKAYSLGCCSIFINLRGREPMGIVMPGEEYGKIREEIIRKLGMLKDSETGLNVVQRVWKREELYSGPLCDSLPDLVVEFLDDCKYFNVTTSLRNTVFFTTSTCATHTRRGIFLAYGKIIRRGLRLEECSICDIAPTILHLINVPISSDVDGRVLREIFEPNSSLAKREVKYMEAPKDETTRGKRAPSFSEEEEREIKERLRALGYLG